jgi:threonine synthase
VRVEDDAGVVMHEVGDRAAGPTVAVVGGVHGDEDEGVVSVRRVVAELCGMSIRGHVRAVPIANPPAYAARSRVSPIDGLNLARVFPGDANGSITRQIARVITDEVIAGTDLLIDLHSAGRDFAMPLFCGYHATGTEVSQRSAAAAEHFGLGLIWAHDVASPGRTLTAAAQLGVPAIYVEASGGGQVRGSETDAYVDGVFRVLHWLGMIDTSSDDKRPELVIRGGNGNVDRAVAASTSGTFVTRVAAGDIVEPGSLVAEIYDDHGFAVERIEVERRSIVMQLRRSARVEAGDPVVLLASPPVHGTPPIACMPMRTRRVSAIREETPVGIGRYASELPAVDGYVSLGEGATPVVALERIGRRVGLPRLAAKLEGLNPTGSYKDRVAAVSMALARREQRRGWIATSSGNAGAALAAYGNRAGLPGFLCVVSSIPREKLRSVLAFGVMVVKVVGVGDRASAANEASLFDRVRQMAEAHDLFLGVTAHRFNPDGMRGVDTIAYELADAGHDPDYVYVPTGGGGLVSGIARGVCHRRLSARVVVAQPSGCAPIVEFIEGRSARPVVDACGSQISGLQLPSPPDGDLAAQNVGRTSGWGTAVSDAAIYAAQRQLAELEGIHVEAAAATALAAAIHDRRDGRLPADADVVLILTATGLKDLSVPELDGELPVCGPDDVGEQVDRWLATAG